LAAHVQRGGGVAMLAGEGDAAANAAALDAALGGDVLPWRLGGPVSHDETGAADRRSIGRGDWQTLALRSFDEASREALRAVRFGRTWSVASEREDARGLLWFDDGTPAMAISRVPGGGTVILAAFGAGPASSDVG